MFAMYNFVFLFNGMFFRNTHFYFALENTALDCCLVSSEQFHIIILLLHTRRSCGVLPFCFIYRLINVYS
jgi:hypothetical protein